MSASQELLIREVKKEHIPEFNVYRIRKDFPILHQKINGKPLVYFDNAATTQKPREVIDAVQTYYTSQNANIHRGIHFLSEQATQLYEQVRFDIRGFINAREMREIIFVRGATEAINLVMYSFGQQNVLEGDEIIISELEHHSNIIPWQILCNRNGAKLRIIPVEDNGELDIEAYGNLLNKKTKLVSVTHVSNALGTINPVKQIISMAHSMNIPVLVDGAQAAPHIAVNVQDLDCDFYTFSGHKVFGPTGVGILYGKSELLNSMPPFQSGGDMIQSVTFEKTTYNSLPYKFEAGTPNIAGGIGLGAAIRYIQHIGISQIAAYEKVLLTYATEQMLALDQLRIIGTTQEKAGVISFILDRAHPHDISTIINDEGIAIRAGHHCAQPVMRRFGVPATARVSFAFYNTKEEVDLLIQAIHKVNEVFS